MKNLSVRVSCNLNLEISEETFNQYREGKLTAEEIANMFQTFFEDNNTSCEVNYSSEITEQVEEQLG